MKRHFLQSAEWAEYERMEGHGVFEREAEEYAYVAVKQQTPLGDYLFCPYGPALNEKVEAGVALKLALDSLAALAREQKAFFVRVEPTVSLALTEMKELGLKPSHEIEPAHTWTIDLTGSQEDLLGGMEPKKRKQWRNYEKKGVRIWQTKDPEKVTILTKLLEKVGARNGFTPQDEQHLRRQLEAGFATLYVAEVEEKPIAASLVYDYDGVRYAVHAGADDEYKKLAGGTILSVQEMVDAQKAGAREFDFWGMTTSEDPKHPWYGFTQYKKTFGGRQVDYAGTWDLPVERWKYWVYNIMRKMNRGLRKVR